MPGKTRGVQVKWSWMVDGCCRIGWEATVVPPTVDYLKSQKATISKATFSQTLALALGDLAVHDIILREGCPSALRSGFVLVLGEIHCSPCCNPFPLILFLKVFLLWLDKDREGGTVRWKLGRVLNMAVETIWTNPFRRQKRYGLPSTIRLPCPSACAQMYKVFHVPYPILLLSISTSRLWTATSHKLRPLWDHLSGSYTVFF